ncbi:MAG TPA: hypothetical protein VD772_05980, partial [Anseongella sp.]|nr:hypothetical protein [Anseongella sp.]
MNSKLCSAALFLCLLVFQAGGQHLIDSLLRDLAETLPESESGEYDLSEVGDRLAWRLRHPLDLNKASFEELHALFILNDLQISSLLEHIRVAGPLADILELQSVRNFDLPSIQRLLPFVRVGTGASSARFSLRTLMENAEQEILGYYSRVLAKQKGYASPDSSRLAGGPERLYFRYRLRSGEQFSLNLLGEKDPGEAFLDKGGTGFDFYSGNIFIRPEGRVKKLILGDYLLQFGQGLNIWNGFSLGKSPAALGIARQAQGVKPYNSSGESHFFRGAAATFGLGKLELSPFISLRKLDATPAEEGGHPAVSAIRSSGLHRSRSEIAAKGTLTEVLGGLNLKYRFTRQLSVGLTGSGLSLDMPLLPGDDLYERYEFSGKQLTLLSLDYTFGRSNFLLFGEIGRSAGAGWAFIKGLLISPAQGLALAGAYRGYGKNYRNRYASPFGEASSAAGEQGFYLGAEARFSTAWTLAAYADGFSYSWLRYQVDAPSKGHELSARLIYNPGKRFTAYGRYRTTTKVRNQEK